MEPLTSLVFCALAFGLLALALRVDAAPNRQKGVAVDGTPVAGARVVLARAHVNGRCGLLNHAGLAPRDGLLLQGSRAVHTRGMLFPIDVVFLDASGRVLAIHENAAPGPGRLAGPQGTRAALELAAFSAHRELGLAAGKLVSFA